MESLVKIVGTGVDTLVMNIYPTDSAGVILKRRVASELQDDLTLSPRYLENVPRNA